MIWSCPLCRSSLETWPSGLRCDQGHCFDRARQGYVNLLPANFKQSKSPGDDNSMLQARRRVLSAGCYQSLLSALNTISQRHLSPREGIVRALDMGGGDGYYSAALSQGLPSVQWYVTDISKTAVKMAAPQFAPLRSAVASSFNLPIADHSVDWVMRNFAPADDTEVMRILRPGGYYCVVTPGEHHLTEMRRCLYQTVKPHGKPAVNDAFQLVSQQDIEFEFTLTASQQREDILAMTPMAWQVSLQRREQWLHSTLTDVTGHCRIALYRVPE